MLIDLTLRGPTIHVGRYPTTLAILLDTGGHPTEPRGRPECGLFTGRDRTFRELEREVRCPEIVPEEDRGREPGYEPRLADSGVHLYLLDRPETQAQINQTLQYHYLAVTWENALDVAYSRAVVIGLTESGGTHMPEHQNLYPDEAPSWWLHIGGIGTIILDDYQPGYLTRTGTAQVLRPV